VIVLVSVRTMIVVIVVVPMIVVIVVVPMIVVMTVVVTMMMVMMRMIVMVVMIAVSVIVVMTMVMVMMTVLLRGFVGAAFRLERRVDRNHLGAERLQQRLDRRISGEPQPPLQDLHRDMAVAEMPGEPRQHGKIAGTNLDQRFRLGHDLDQSAIVEHQCVVGAQPHGLGEIQLHADTFDAEQEALLDLLALCVGQDQRVDDIAAVTFGCGL